MDVGKECNALTGWLANNKEKEQNDVHNKYITLMPEEVSELKKMADFILRQKTLDEAQCSGIQLATIVNFIIKTKGV